jgi:hypothetical protein
MLLAVLSASAGLGAAELKTGTAADWLPADAAFYSTHLRLKEVFDIAANSKAWKKLKSIPTIQFGWTMANSQIQQTGVLQQLEAMQLPEFGADLVSQEAFVYGDDSLIDFIGLMQAMNGVGKFNQLGDQLQGKEKQATGNVRALLDVLAEDTDLVQAPNFLMGFRLKNTDLAGAQIDRLEQLLQSVLEDQPELKERLTRAKVDDYEYLTFTVDGGMIPEEELEKIKDLEESEGDYDEVIDAVKEATVTVSIGVREDYLLLSVGSENELLENLGGDEVLSSRPEFKRLAPHLKKRLLSINYISKEAAESLGMKPEDFGNLAEAGKQFLAMAELDEDAQQRIANDIDELVEDLKKYVVSPGGTLGFEFLTDNGTEGFTYTDSVNPAVDGSKPLPVLAHVGGEPLVAIAGRAKYQPEDYQLLVKWLTRGRQYAEEFGLSQAPEEVQQKYRKFMDDTAPLWERLDKATGQMLLPALKDGQSALVLDAKIVSKRWHQEMPESDRDLPMLEAAVVLGVSDPALLRKAVSEYKTIINGFIERAREENPEIPEEVKVPDAEKLSSKEGAVYKYSLPSEAGVDELIAPSAGLTDKFAALSSSPDQVKRVLEERPLAGSKLLASAKGPTAGAVYFNWAGFVQAIAPWVDYGMIHAMGGGDRENVEALVNQVNTGLEVLQVLRTVESVVTIEGGTTVSHTVSVWKDVE